MMQKGHTPNFRYIWMLVFTVCSMVLHSQEESSKETSANFRKFEGLYIGANTGIQSVFSEAVINELSVPQQSSRWVAEFMIAHRWQFLNDRIVFGLEVQVGLTDGNLNRSYGVFPELEIDFNNNSQAGLGYTLGYVSGKGQNLLLYTYLYQTRRTFDITLQDSARVLQWQRDIQTVLRYGLGAEYNLGKRLSIRSALGVQTADLNNTIDIDDSLEFTLGFTYQF